MNVDKLTTYLGSINKLFPSLNCLVIGAGNGRIVETLKSLKLQEVVLVEADQKQIEKMRKMHDLPHGYRVENALIYKDDVNVKFYKTSNPSLNCVTSPKKYKELMPNVTVKDVDAMPSYSLTTFLEKKALMHINWLIVDTYTALDILKYSQESLTNLDAIACRIVTNKRNKLSLFMDENGFTPMECFEDINPQINMCIYVKDYKKKEQTTKQELTQKLQEQKESCEKLKQTFEQAKSSHQTEIEVLNKTLTELTNRISSLALERENVLAQIQQIEDKNQTYKEEIERLKKQIEHEKATTQKELKDKINVLLEEKNKLSQQLKQEKESSEIKLQKANDRNEEIIKLQEVNSAKIHSLQQEIAYYEDDLKKTQFIFNQIGNDISSKELQYIALAENALNRKDFKEAIVCYQEVAASLSMPQVFYRRLRDAYRLSGGFPLASEEEEALRGDFDKHEFLKQLHQELSPSLYLEIGVQTGKSLLLASCKAIGIDPMPLVKDEDLPINTELVHSISDEFFEYQAKHILIKAPDLVFIDGMHLFEYALRDFINVEKYSNQNTIVIIDDIYPGHISQAQRRRKTRAWTGDVWKIFAILKAYRKDLEITTLDIYPTGLMFIRGLDKNNRVLSENYETIKEEYMNKEIDTDLYIERVGSVEPIEFLKELSKGKML